MTRSIIRIATLAMLLQGIGTAFAETVVSIHEGSMLAAEAKLSTCSSGCSKQMGVTARHHFVFNGEYAALYNQLSNVSIKVTAYDDGWIDAETGTLSYKVGSTVHRQQRWRRTILQRRKIEQVEELAAAILATASPGQTITLEFEQEPQRLTGTDFTVNVKQYHADSIVESRSRAVTANNFISDDPGYNSEQ